MSEEVSIHRSTVRLEKPIYDVLVGVAMKNHLHTPRRGSNSSWCRSKLGTHWLWSFGLPSGTR